MTFYDFCEFHSPGQCFRVVVCLSVVVSVIFLLSGAWHEAIAPIEFECDLDKSPPVHVLPADKLFSAAHCNVTFVTAYFDIPSKHDHSEYVKWISNQRNMCLVVFTDSPALWKVPGQIVFETSLCEEGRALNMSSSFWRDQWFLDPEAVTHRGPQLYITWNLKPYFMSQAARINPFSSEYFFWIDAGYTRSVKLGDARSLNPSLEKDAMYFLLLGQFSRQEMLGGFHYTVGKEGVGGGMFGGHISFVDKWVALYYRVFHEYVKRGWFVGKDQNLLNSLCSENPGVCMYFSLLDEGQGDVWFSMWDCLLHQQRCSVHRFYKY